MLLEIPENWCKPEHQSEVKATKTALEQKRREDILPHISYDLDGRLRFSSLNSE
jgi:hypothetical protein